MPDLTGDPLFVARVAAFREGVTHLADSGVDDSVMLVERTEGWNNLQGHARAVIPLAIWLLERHPDLGEDLRRATNLHINMTRGSRESRLRVWESVKMALIQELRRSGSDRIATGNRANSPNTARRIAQTYLSDAYGGGQVGGGAGDTVLKRSLKLAAFLFPFS